ncbi:hypothetical protein T01_13649 [Trichinella spiralis]|uniref:Uncharacterized protein n=1 Tax=Trichinella spiralis TaxID=6334 RepID=A0A0V1AWX6_TRISP|nr:hypothetical protein T01_13649 [Trichinella spiralis]
MHLFLLVDLQNAISQNSILAEQRGLQQQAQAIDFLVGIRRDSRSGFGVVKSDNWLLKNNGSRGVDASG